jgi:hypothetical protein
MKHNTSSGLAALNPERCKLIACATVIEEMLPLMPPSMQYQKLDFGLHVNPKELKITLQEAIKSSSSSADFLILGYGLCSQAVVGLKAENCSLIIPRVDDCIAIFLGSADKYQQQLRHVPGTYYLTKGWIESGDTPFDEYNNLEKMYGIGRAREILSKILKNYTRLALINTGQYKIDNYREHARGLASRFDLQFEEIPGSDSLIKAMLYGPWDDRFVVAGPHQTIEFCDFKD